MPAAVSHARTNAAMAAPGAMCRCSGHNRPHGTFLAA